MPENLRRNVRRTVHLPARLEFPWGHLEGRLENIGEGGGFFVTGTLEGVVGLGESVHVCFGEAEGTERRVPAEVLRMERYFHEGDLYRAFALKFREPLSSAGA
jgi:hypothetical protein